MTTTPPPDRSSSPSQKTGYKNKLGQDIPAEAFENDAGPPGEPKSLSPENLSKFDKKTAELLAAAKSPKA